MIGSLCTGYGGLDLAAQAVFGQELTWWSDIEPGPIKVMQHHHPDVPNLGDLKTVDWFSVPEIDILTAGYPCQPFSNAGKRLGTEDPRHLWPWISDAVGLLRPRYVVLENVAAHLRKGFDIVSADLASMGYSVAWGIVSAAEAGAPHGRKRLYVVAADASRKFSERDRAFGSGGGVEYPDSGVAVAHPDGTGLQGDVGSDQTQGTEPQENADAERSGGAPLAHTYGQFLREQSWWGRGPNGPRSSFPGLIGPPGVPDPGRWRKYASGIARWERVLGIPAPEATVPNPRAKTGRSLSPFLTEWMMGVPGRITSVPGIDRNAQIRLAGNGVVPQQAILAIRELLRRLA